VNFLDQLATRLEAQGVGAVGTDIFLYNMPAQAKSGVLLLEPQLGARLDHELPGYRMVRYPITVRTSHPETGYQLAKKVISALTITRQQALGGFTVNYMRSVHEPVPFPVDEGDLVEYAVHVDTCYVVASESNL
jgi:hypothetical protein